MYFPSFLLLSLILLSLSILTLSLSLYSTLSLLLLSLSIPRSLFLSIPRSLFLSIPHSLFLSIPHSLFLSIPHSLFLLSLSISKLSLVSCTILNNVHQVHKSFDNLIPYTVHVYIEMYICISVFPMINIKGASVIHDFWSIMFNKYCKTE